MIGDTIFKPAQQMTDQEYTIDELMKILEAEKLTDPKTAKIVTEKQKANIRSARQHMSTPEYTLSPELVEQGYNGFVNVRERVEKLAEAQAGIEAAVKARSSPVYKFVELARVYVNEKLGKEAEEKGVDSLIERRAELMGDLHDAIKESEDYSIQLLEMLRTYRVEHVTGQMLDSINYHQQLEAYHGNAAKTIKAVEQHLQQAKPTDESYKALVTAQANLKVRKQYVESELAKTKVDVVFKRDQKANISVLEDMITLGVDYCDMIALNMANVRETMQYTIPALHLLQEQDAIATMSARATDPATEYIMLNVQKTKQTMQAMAQLAASVKQKGSLPGILVKLLDNYAGGMARTAKMSSQKIEAEANRIITQPGYTA